MVKRVCNALYDAAEAGGLERGVQVKDLRMTASR